MGTLGKRPELRWIDKRLLKIDTTYQRPVDGDRSRRLIALIAEDFSWPRCGALVVTKDHAVVDGQHRLAAAILRDDIKDLPCLVHNLPTSQEQADVFVDMNRNKVALTPFAILKAQIAANNPEATAIVRIATEAGVMLLLYPIPLDKMKPGQIMAVNLVRSIYRQHGEPHLSATLKAIQTAHPKRPGQFTQGIIAAVSSLLLEGMPPKDITLALAATDARSAYAEALTRHAANPSRKTTEILKEMLADGTAPKPAPFVIAAKPFTFDRSKSKPARAKAPENRGNVKPRRIEAGSMMVLVERALVEKGISLERNRGPKPYRMNGKPVTFEEVVAKADHIRAAKGLPSLTARRA